MLPLMLWLSYALFQHLATGYLRNERSGQSAMNLPVWPFRIVFLVAFTLLALQILRRSDQDRAHAAGPGPR